MNKPPIQGILVIRPHETRGAETMHYFHRGEAPMNTEQLRAAHPDRFPKDAPGAERLHVTPLSESTVLAMRFLDACAEQGDMRARIEVNSVLMASMRWAQGAKARRPDGDDLDLVLRAQPEPTPVRTRTSSGPRL